MAGETASIPDITYRSYGITSGGTAGLLQDDNLLNRNYFRFTIQRIPNFERFVRSVLVPPFRFGELVQPTTLNLDIKLAGGSFEFLPLQVGFVLDERFYSYIELYNWITSIGMIENPTTIERKAFTSDATLLVTNSAYVPQYRIVFKDLYPIALGELDFTSAEPISSPLISNVTFNYTKFEIHNANGNLCDNLLG
tara:strand:- start:294 stop:878 length:585 start_codon:yes stop_codon:yes gene_type:complete